MNIKLIRKLACSTKWQNLYSMSKELNGIKLFYNEIDFTYVQIIFLYWLSIYNNLYTDLYLKEKYINEDVIKDDIRCDAYLLYKSKEKKDKKENKDIKSSHKKTKFRDNSIPSIIFTSKGKE